MNDIYVDQIRILLGISTSKHDMYIEEMIPILIDYARDHCRNQFKDGIPGPVRLFVAKAIEYNMNPVGVSSRSMGGASYSYETDFPPSITRLLKPYRKVRFV